MKTPRLSLFFKLLITALLVTFVLRKIDLRLAVQIAGTINTGWIVLAVLLFYPSQLISVYRWYFILTQMGYKAPFMVLLRNYVLGQFSALFLPGQISGDIIRTAATIRNSQNPPIIITSVLIDKLSFLIILLFSAMLGIQFSVILNISAKEKLGVILALILFIVAYFLFIHLGNITKWEIIENIFQGQGGITIFGKKILTSLKQIKHFPPSSTIIIGGISGSVVIMNVFGNYLLGRGLQISIGLWDWFVISAVIGLVQLIPITIGGLGLRESAFIGILKLYQVSSTQAVMLSILGFILITSLNAIGWLITTNLRITQPNKSLP
jgi:uncharacterized membrane protein YbhN (UPF0104 family)